MITRATLYREDATGSEIEIEVDVEISGSYQRATCMDPPETPEVRVVEARLAATGEAVELTAKERASAKEQAQEIAAEVDGPDPDEAYDRMREERLSR